ncbi:MAG: NusG domain II-containing protein [Clostridiales bacterium]|nr:NusG domain II-containing protein [Clostridiales bacterium]
MKKQDWFIVGGALLLALIVFFAARLITPNPSGATVTVYVQGEVYAKVGADDYQTITIDQGDGKVNVVVIDESGVRMESSSCKNQICVHHGVIDPHDTDELLLDNWIICLPNGVAIEVTGAGEEP